MKNLKLSFLLALVGFFSVLTAKAADNITTLGQISAVYQSRGDMMTLNASALPLRIPIGTTGQVLAVSSGGIPAWTSTFAAITSVDTGAATPFTIKINGTLEATVNDDAITLNSTSSRLEANDTTDGTDTSEIKLQPYDGTTADGSRGALLRLSGADHATRPGFADLVLGDAAANFRIIGNTGGTILLDIEDNGDVATFATEVALSVSGKTLALQEATAGAACSGTATCNGATDVTTATTCATTGSRIFLQRSSADTDGVGQMYVKSISNGTNFVVNCVTANDTSTFNWIIFHEAP